MSNHIETRNRYLYDVYCNFSSHECITAAHTYANEAAAVGDTYLERFCRLNARRRRLLSRQPGDAGSVLLQMAQLASELRGAEPGSPDALLGAIATPRSACGAYAALAPQIAEIATGQVGATEMNVSDAANALLGPQKEPPHDALFKTAYASAGLFRLNANFRSGFGAEVGIDQAVAKMDEDFAPLVKEIPDYSPAYFSYANNLRRAYLEGADSVAAEAVTEAYSNTVEVEKNRLRNWGDFTLDAEIEELPVWSGLALALSQQRLAMGLLRSEPSETGDITAHLDKLDEYRFDHLLDR